MNTKKMTRRKALQTGVGTVAGLLAVATHAESVEITPDQDEGPFFPIHEQADKDADMTLLQGHTERAKGDVIVIHGRVVDESGAPVAGALIDIWQANAVGRYSHEKDPNTAPLDENFQSWAKLVTGDDGEYRLKTIKPGDYPATADWWRPPHIHFKVAKRGFRELTTQMYFAGEELNDKDFLLQELPAEEQQKLIVTMQQPEAGTVPTGQFQIVLAKVS